MQVAAIFGDGSVGLTEQPDLKPEEDYVLVKVVYAATCTEYKYLAAQPTDGKADEVARVGFGHEAVGEVVEVAQPGQVKVGDRVVVMWVNGCGNCAMCDSGEVSHCPNLGQMPPGSSPKYAQYVLQKDLFCKPIPDDISFKHAAAALCGMGPSFEAMDLMQLNAFDTVLITGMGPVGLGGVINASYLGARIIAVEGVPYRVNLAKELGAEVVLDPADDDLLEKIKALTGGVGVDKAVDCSAAAAAQRLCVEAVRTKGQVGFPGEGGDFTIDTLRELGNRGLTLRGNKTMNFHSMPRLMDVIRASADKMDKYLSHTFPMSRVQEVWELQTTGACGKVLLDPWG